MQGEEGIFNGTEIDLRSQNHRINKLGDERKKEDRTVAEGARRSQE